MYNIAVKIVNEPFTVDWVMDDGDICKTIKLLESTDLVEHYTVTRPGGEFVDVTNEFGFGKTELKKN